MESSKEISTSVVVDKNIEEGRIWIVKMNGSEKRNAVDFKTAKALSESFLEFEKDNKAIIAILCGEGGNFCAGADLKAMNDSASRNALVEVPEMPEDANGAVLDVTGPMGISRMKLSKPVIAAVSGYSVAGGLELACWCDLRVVDETAIFGVFCRRFGVPLIDGGTVRLPLLIGHSRAMDMILTGKAVDAKEALSIGLANRLIDSTTYSSTKSSFPPVVQASIELAIQIANFPQICMRSDRLSALNSSGKPLRLALKDEFNYGFAAVREEGLKGAKRFSAGIGRHGAATTSTRAKL
jgi:enoyl-CoA hydratase